MWNDANVRHHATVLMFQDVAVIDKIANLRKRNLDLDRRHLAGSALPGRDATVAFRTAVIHRHVIHHTAAVATGRIGWQHAKAGLVNMEVVVLPGDIHKLPAFGHRPVPCCKWQAYADGEVVKWLDVLEGTCDRLAMLIQLLVAQTKAIRLSRRHAEINPAHVSGRKG